jgi:hypothetical protein
MTNANLDFETGSSVLVTAPEGADGSASGRALAHLPHDETNAVVVVTCDRSADSFLGLWRQHVGTLPDALRVIEVGATMRSSESSTDQSIAAAVDTVHRPNDLDGIRAAITSALAAFDDETVEISGDTNRAIRSSTTGRRSTACSKPSVRDGDALRYLLDTERTVEIDELARAVARRDIGEKELTPDHHHQYYATLYQLHLPKLDSVGLIDHDEREHRVSVRENARWAASFLALTEE